MALAGNLAADQRVDRIREQLQTKGRLEIRVAAELLATALDSARDLTVVTNGPETFRALQGKPGVRAVLTGGELDPRTGSLVGKVAVRAASTFLLRHAFVSAAAVEATTGASEATVEQAEVKQVFANVVGTVVLAVDGSKLDSRSAATGLQWDEVSTLVTDLERDSPRLAHYRDVTRVI